MSSRRMKIPEGMRTAYQAARAAGWTVTFTGGNHLKWTPPGGRFVITAATPNGGRHSTENDLRQLRSAGLPC